MTPHPASPPAHRSRVLAAPWPGVHGSELDSARAFGRHWHASHGIGLVLGGAQRSASGVGTVDAQAGELITHNPGEVHDGRPLGGVSRHWRMLHLDDGALAGFGAATIEFTRPVLRDALLQRVLRRLFARWDAVAGAPATDPRWLAVEEALAALVAAVRARRAAVGGDAAPCEADRAARGGPAGTGSARTDSARNTRARAHADGADSAAGAAGTDRAVERMRERLADPGAAPPSLAELGAPAGLSRYQALRRFEAAFGLPPHAWLQRLRIERAHVAIARGMPLAQAAADAGFADQSHMTRLFARQFGYSPGAWRRAALTFVR